MTTHNPRNAKTRTNRPHARKTGTPLLYQWTDTGFAVLKSPDLVSASAAGQAVLGVSLGLRRHDRLDFIRILKDGLTMAAFEHLCRALELSLAELAAVAGIAERTLARRKKEGRLRFDESERVYRIAALFDQAVEALGDAAHARAWFKTPLKALGGKAPLAYADTGVGAREVEDLLGRLEHGVFA
jgi:putative toxin-antitoxin system antitoxin component (TIGR02293 family)